MNYPKDFNPGNRGDVYDLQGSTMWVENDLVYIHPKPDIEHNIDVAKEQTSVFQEKIVEQGKQYSLICDVRNIDPINKECRDYYSSDEAAQNVSSFCFLVDSKFSMVMANFFIGLTTLKVKVKMFTSVPQAVTWSKKNIVL